MTKLKRQGVPGKVRRSVPVGIDYAALLEAIAHLHADAQRHAVQAVNLGLTLRNWAIGSPNLARSRILDRRVALKGEILIRNK